MRDLYELNTKLCPQNIDARFLKLVHIYKCMYVYIYIYIVYSYVAEQNTYLCTLTRRVPVRVYTKLVPDHRASYRK